MMSQPLMCQPVFSGRFPFFVFPRDDERRSSGSLSPLSDGEEQQHVIEPEKPIKPLCSDGGPSVRFPCKARRVPDDHNVCTAYIDLPPTAVHGTILICSHPVCANSGRRFRFCAICQLPVAKRNFNMRHSDASSTHSVKRRRRSNSDALRLDHRIHLLVKKESSEEEEVPHTVLVDPLPSVSNSEASLTSPELTFKELGMLRSPHLPDEPEWVKPIEDDASSTHSVKRTRLSNGAALRFDHNIHLLVEKESSEEQVPHTVPVEPLPSVSNSEASLTSPELTFKYLGMLRSPRLPDEQESVKSIEDDASSTHNIKRQHLSNGDALRFDHKIHLLVKKDSSEGDPAPSVSNSEASLASSELPFKDLGMLRSPRLLDEQEFAKPVEDDASSTHSVKRQRLSNGDALRFDHKIHLLVESESSEGDPAPSVSNSEVSLASSELSFNELGLLRSPHLPDEQESAKPVEDDASSTHRVERQRLSNGDALRFDHKIHLLVEKESSEEPHTILVEPLPSVSNSEVSITSSELTFKDLGMLRSPHLPVEQELAKPVEDDASSSHSAKRQRLSNGDALRFDHKIHLLVESESSEEEVPRTVFVEPAPSMSNSEVSLTSSELTFKEIQWLALYRNRPSSLESERDFREWMDAIIEAADFDDIQEDGDDAENYENYLSLFLEDVDVKQQE